MPHTLEEILSHEFRNKDLLQMALTHRSLDGVASNQRLEFLGDRVIGLVVAHMLFEAFPGEQEGELARRHAGLVSKDALAEVAREIGLGDHLLMSDSEDTAGGRKNTSHLEDACEALIGALYLDGGMQAAEVFIEKHWKPLLLSVKEPPKDSKTALQEWAQARGMPLPEYIEVRRSGPDHAPEFEIEVRLGEESATGAAGAKRAAEQFAAANLLSRLKP